MSTITMGVDLAKRVFSVCGMDAAGHVLRRQNLKRETFAAWLAQRPAGTTVVAMEACTGAHHWARRCIENGLQPKVLVAIANERARQVWAMLARGVDYDPGACLRNPMHRPAHSV